MANHKSAIKRHRQSLKRRDRNRLVKGAVRTAVKKTRAAAEAGNIDEARQLLLVAEKRLAKAATKGVFHKRSASRSLSRLASLVNKSAAA